MNPVGILPAPAGRNLCRLYPPLIPSSVRSDIEWLMSLLRSLRLFLAVGLQRCRADGALILRMVLTLPIPAFSPGRRRIVYRFLGMSCGGDGWSGVSEQETDDAIPSPWGEGK